MQIIEWQRLSEIFQAHKVNIIDFDAKAPCVVRKSGTDYAG